MLAGHTALYDREHQPTHPLDWQLARDHDDAPVVPGRTAPSTLIAVVRLPAHQVMLKTSITVCKPDPPLFSPLTSRANAPNRTAAARRLGLSYRRVLAICGILFSLMEPSMHPQHAIDALFALCEESSSQESASQESRNTIEPECTSPPRMTKDIPDTKLTPFKFTLSGVKPSYADLTQLRRRS
jgi:hypothetical protein